MKSDVNGCSTTEAGQENYEFFTVRLLNGRKSDRVQYDYRTNSGDLFSCVATSLENARQRRNKWLDKQG